MANGGPIPPILGRVYPWEDDCSICLMRFRIGQPVAFLCAQHHHIHWMCFREWERKAAVASCPICRDPVVLRRYWIEDGGVLGGLAPVRPPPPPLPQPVQPTPRPRPLPVPNSVPGTATAAPSWAALVARAPRRTLPEYLLRPTVRQPRRRLQFFTVRATATGAALIMMYLLKGSLGGLADRRGAVTDEAYLWSEKQSFETELKKLEGGTDIWNQREECLSTLAEGIKGTTKMDIEVGMQMDFMEEHLTLINEQIVEEVKVQDESLEVIGTSEVLASQAGDTEEVMGFEEIVNEKHADEDSSQLEQDVNKLSSITETSLSERVAEMEPGEAIKQNLQ